jgi:hypothetical protein
VLPTSLILLLLGGSNNRVYIAAQHTLLLATTSTSIMSMRNTSGKFSIPFGRKSDKTPASPTGNGPTHGRFFSSGGGSGDDDFGPGGEKGNGSGGLNLGKRIAHQSLIPGLGNQDLRQLQE